MESEVWITKKKKECWEFEDQYRNIIRLQTKIN